MTHTLNKCPICDGEVKTTSQSTDERGILESLEECLKCHRYSEHFAYGYSETCIGNIIIHSMHETSKEELEWQQKLIEQIIAEYRKHYKERTVMEINIAKDFSETPGARYRKAGKYSGEEFKDDLLNPKFLEARANKEKLIINLDGGYGYPVSFIEEAFGGLARKHGSKAVLETLRFISNDDVSLPREIQQYIEEAISD